MSISRQQERVERQLAEQFPEAIDKGPNHFGINYGKLREMFGPGFDI